MTATRRLVLHLRHCSEKDLHAWLGLAVAPLAGGALTLDLDVARAVAADPVCFISPLPASYCLVLRGEIATGILAARRRCDSGCAVTLERLGGSSGEARAIDAVPTIAYGVAATLGVLHGLGHVDLRSEPIGGHGWLLERFEET